MTKDIEKSKSQEAFVEASKKAKKDQYAESYMTSIVTAFVSGYATAKNYTDKQAMEIMKKFKKKNSIVFDGTNISEVIKFATKIANAYKPK